jgi:hypothetical protein
MRLIGMAERAFDLMCERAIEREAFGKPIARQGVFQHWIAQARVRIEQARLLTLKAAWMMDTVGNKGARMEISAIKIVAPSMAEWVLDKAIQTHGGKGFTNDTPLALMWAHARTLRMADGPDEVHEMALARREGAARRSWGAGSRRVGSATTWCWRPRPDSRWARGRTGAGRHAAGSFAPARRAYDGSVWNTWTSTRSTPGTR